MSTIKHKDLKTDPEFILNAPHLTPVSRLDESIGLGEQVLRWRPSEA